jgi:hypothetical protein
MALVVGLGVSLVLGLLLSSMGGVLSALAEIFAAATSPWPLVVTGAVAFGVAWLGLAIWRASTTPGERVVGAALLGTGVLLAIAGALIWRAVHEARIPDHEPRG